MSWLLSQGWLVAALKWGALAGAVLLFLVGYRRLGERLARANVALEQEEHAREVQERMLEAEGSRPRSRDELADRLRDGTY